MFALRPSIYRSGLLLAALTLSTSAALATEMASATITSVQSSPGVYDYSITLTDTGTTTLGTFWFGWIPGAGYLTTPPSLVNSPAGWTEKLTSGNLAIQWTTTTSLINPGQSLTGFEFFSTETPDQLPQIVVNASKGNQPGDVFYVYAGAPLGDAGFTSQAVLAPEPPAALLTLTGVLGMAAFLKRKQLHLQ